MSLTTIQVRVTPKAKHQRIVRETTEAGDIYYRAYVTQVPEDGKANQAVIALLAKELGIPKSRLNIVKGEKSKDKIVVITPP